jgi:superfamily II DNA or RNA helicase
MDRLADRCDLLMLDECHCAAADGVAQALAKFGGARRFGFSASPKGRGDKADLLQEALLGPVRHERTYAESVEAGSIVPIDVSMIKYDHPPRMFAVRLSMKRNGIWRNNIRNDVIARVADAAIKRGQTLIMCETVEHVMELRRRLPGWTTVFATCDREWYNSFREAGYTDEPWRTDKEMLAIQDKFAAGEIQGAICTGVWREGVDLVNLRVLIRADGLAGMIPSIQIPGRLSRRIEGKDRAELIDFHDEFNNDMMQATMARVRAYKSKGWSIKYVEKIGV